MDGIEQGVFIVNKTLSEVMDPKYDSPSARIQLLATGLQESKFMDRVQMGGGPAHSFWQEEPNGIKAVLGHPVVGSTMVAMCEKLGVPADWASVYKAVINNDVLACVVARLILYADPHPLPRVGDSDGAWQCYLRNWRPGRPRPDTWPGNYKKAMEHVDV
jgi:hypothetical protein